MRLQETSPETHNNGSHPINTICTLSTVIIKILGATKYLPGIGDHLLVGIDVDMTQTLGIIIYKVQVPTERRLHTRDPIIVK